jgi:hypothetical protein
MANSEQNLIPLPGSDRTHPRGVHRIGPAPHGQLLAVSLILRPGKDAPALPDMDHWEKTPPRERRYLPRYDEGAVYGADQADIEKVTDFLRKHGLSVVGSHPARRRVDVTGTVAQFDAAFGITIGLYRWNGKTYHGHEGPVHVPRALAPIIRAIFGLDGRRMAHRLGTGLTLSALTPPNVASLYGFPSLPANMAAQTIGIFEFGGGFTVDSSGNATDVDAFLAGLHPALPKPKLLTPTVPQVLPDPPVSNSPGNAAHPNGTDGEVVLDIDVVSSIAVGATIAVYFSNFTENGWLNAIQTSILPSVGDPAPSVITISYGIDEAFWSAGQLQTLSSYFQHAAAMGVTVFTASGDDGSMGNAPEPDGRAHVCYPAVDPWITTVGGTTIGNVSGSAFDEVTWVNPHGVRGTTGGGVSTMTDSSGNLVFPLPSWQTGAGVPPSINDGKTRGRGLPDIAGYSNGYGVVLYGSNAGFGGTSEASPLYAGLVAILNAKLGFKLGWLNPTIYQLAETIGFDIFRDIDDDASNSVSYKLPPPNPPTIITSPGYNAIKGWDACTGWGSLKAKRFFAALAHLPLVATAIAHDGQFGNACVNSPVGLTLTINNSGFGLLTITAITSSSADFLVPSVSAFPLLVSVGNSIDVTIRFQPGSAGAKSGKITIVSNDPSSPHVVDVSGDAVTPRLDLAIADTGDFGPVCVGAFKDEPLVLSNGGKCPLSVASINSSDTDFLVPEVLSYPLIIAPGTALPLPIRFAPTSLGAKSATLSVSSNDPGGERKITVRGTAPAGTLTVTGSANFGGVPCCTRALRVVTVCNTGACNLQVIEVGLKQTGHAYRIENNPFPATLRPGSSLGVTVQYYANEKIARAAELVIHSNDPHTPVKCVEVVAYTNWEICEPRCEEAPAPCCKPRHKCGCEQPPKSCREVQRRCCDDDDAVHEVHDHA